MMECDEIIDHIDAAEFALTTMRAVHAPNRRVTSFTVAAFAFAEMSHERDCEDMVDEFNELLRLVRWVLALRKGTDPRCDLCKQNGKLKWNPKVAHQVLQ